MSLSKRLGCAMLALILLFSLSSCSRKDANDFMSAITLGLWDRIILDEDIHNIITFHDDETLEYRGLTYYKSDFCFTRYQPVPLEDLGYELICWCGPRFFYISTYYGDGAESPTVIQQYFHSTTYFREDYDYTADSFKIEGTEATITLGEDLLTLYEAPMPRTKTIVLRLVSTTHSFIDGDLLLCSDGQQWYVTRINDGECFALSENFLLLLKENGIIE